MAGILFAGDCSPLHQTSTAAPVSYESSLATLGTHPVCRLLFDRDDPAAWHREDVDLIYVLPPGPGPHQIVPEHHAALVAALDQGGRIALHGTHDTAICQAIEAVLALVGGAHG